MKPPKCPVCGLSIHNLPERRQGQPLFASFELVEFSNYRGLPDGISGHPEGLEWFCLEHAGQAKKLAHLPLNEALDLLLDN
jgi:hypothetical protein